MVRTIKSLGPCFRLTLRLTSSAKDQLTAQAVAVKKIMKPFSTPVLSKRTYRELKLLKHLRHENVRQPPSADGMDARSDESIRSSASATSSFLPLRTCKCISRVVCQSDCDLRSEQLLRDRAPRNRSPPPAHLKAARETVHSILPLPDSGQYQSRNGLQWTVLTFRYSEA